MTINIQHIDHIALTVRDVEKSTTWYCDVLGLEHRYKGMWDGVPAMLFVGETGLALFPSKADTPSPFPRRDPVTMTHFAFRVNRENFEAAQIHLTKLDIPFDFQDHDIAHSIYFYDPDRHQIELTTYDKNNDKN